MTTQDNALLEDTRVFPGYHTQTHRKPVRQCEQLVKWGKGSTEGSQSLLTIFLFKFEVISHKELGKELLVQTLNGLCSLLTGVCRMSCSLAPRWST